MIPKIIYMYWEGEMDVFTKACYENIIEQHPNFKISLLNHKSQRSPGDNVRTLSVQHRSDWNRLEAISKTGGVWIDINCVLLKSLESWVEFDSDKFHGFRVPFGCDIVENWAFAAPKNCPIVKQWKKEFDIAVEKGFKIYNKENEIPDCLRKWLPYLTQHHCFHIALKKINKPNIIILNSTHKRMPFHLATICKWKNECIIKKFKEEKQLDYIFIKFNGGQRKDIIKHGIRRMNFLERLQKNTHRYSHIERILKVRIGTQKEDDRIVLSSLCCIFIAYILLVFKQLNNFIYDSSINSSFIYTLIGLHCVPLIILSRSYLYSYNTHINILTRSGRRKECFDILKTSISSQTYKMYSHLISNDNDNNDFLKKQSHVFPVEFVEKDKDKYKGIYGGGHCPYNVYLNELLKHGKKGWNIVIDDDAILIDRRFLENLARECSKASKNDILVYDIYIGPGKEKSPIQFEKQLKNNHIILGHIDMNSFAFHSSCTIKFNDMCAGDWRFIKAAKNAGYNIKYIKIPVGVWSNYKGWSHGKHVSCIKPKI